MSVVLEGKVNSHRRMISVDSEPDMSEDKKFNRALVMLQGNQEKHEARLDTGADANFILLELATALKLDMKSCKEDFIVGDGSKLRVDKVASISFQIMTEKKTYTEPYTADFFVTDKTTGGCKVTLGTTLCKQIQILKRNQYYAVMERKQTKESKVATEIAAADRRKKDKEDLAIVERDTKTMIAKARASGETSDPAQGTINQLG